MTGEVTTLSAQEAQVMSSVHELVDGISPELFKIHMEKNNSLLQKKILRISFLTSVQIFKSSKKEQSLRPLFSR
ncbi:MAG: hypothetical protein CM1200mP14_20970 [Gammaproteobacteria bacterium]|nr:MAG: hypothetical protein CM1200mP14_20970 [Gammaproteobacteria bacterium]